MKNTYFQVRMSDEEKADLTEVAANLPDTTASDIAREAIREKVAKLKKKIAAPKLAPQEEAAAI